MENREYGQNILDDTREESNEKVDRKRRYSQILEILKGNKMTAKEIAIEMYLRGYSYSADRNIASPRLTEMLKSGQVDCIGKKLCEYSNKKVGIYVCR